MYRVIANTPTNKPFPIVPLVVAVSVSIGAVGLIGAVIVFTVSAGPRKASGAATAPPEKFPNTPLFPTTPAKSPAPSVQKTDFKPAAPAAPPRTDQDRLVGTWRTTGTLRDGVSVDIVVAFTAGQTNNCSIRSTHADGTVLPTRTGTYFAVIPGQFTCTLNDEVGGTGGFNATIAWNGDNQVTLYTSDNTDPMLCNAVYTFTREP